MKTREKMKRGWTGFLAVATLAVAFAGIAWGSPGQNELLDRQGNLYQLRSTTYGQEVPDGTSALPETPILVLDISTADGTCLHQIVPRSLGWEADTEGRLFLDSTSGTVYVLWVVKGWGTDEVRLSVERGGSWVGEYRISDAYSAGRQNLDVVLGRQFVQPLVSSVTSPVPQLSLMLQAVWWEAFPWGGGAPRYTPVFLAVDGSVDESSLGSYDPTADETDGSIACGDQLPEAAFYPSVTRETLALSHLTLFSTASCQFEIVPISFMTVAVSGDGGASYQARHIPFIGLKSHIDNAYSMAVTAGGSRFDSSGSGDLGYMTALSWIDESTFRYQIYNAPTTPMAWSDAMKINLTSDMTVDRARSLVRGLLDSR